MLKRLVRVVLAVAAIAFPAAAGIPEFNEAMRRGDIKAAAAEAVEIWKTWDTTDRDTALMAREFGFITMLAGEHEAARNFGQFLADEGASLPTPDDYPLTSAVLLRAAEYKLDDGGAERQALLDALKARAELSGVDLITAAGAETLYGGDWSKGDWDDVIESTAIAADFFSRDADGLLPRLRRAEQIGAAANFLDQRTGTTQGRNATYGVMADVHDRIAADIDADDGGRHLAQLWPLKWEAEAWAYSIEAYLTSDYEQVNSLISTKLDPRRLVQPETGYVAVDPELAAFPICPGEFKGRRMRYPSSQSFSGLVGSVLVRVETDASGKVVDTELLASVPVEAFAESVIRTISTWTYTPDRDADLRNCRVQFNSYVYKVLFVIG